MAWQKSSEELIAAFAAALPDDPAAERGQWFGYPAAFVNGNMFSGLKEERAVVRLPDDGAAELARVGGTPFLKSYMVVPPAIVADAGALRGWVARAFAHTQTLEMKGEAALKAKAAARPKAVAKAKAGGQRGRG